MAASTKRSRPRREVSDAVILDATARAFGEFGSRVTLAQIGRKAGLSAGRLVQRFGGRSQLILAACEHFEAVNRGRMEELARAASPLGGLLDWVRPGVALTPDMAAGFFEWLLMVRRDTVLRNWYGRYLATMRRDFARILAAAVEAGELIPTDVEVLAVRIQQVMFGRLADLAIQVGSEAAVGAGDTMADLVQPYRRPRPA